MDIGNQTRVKELAEKFNPADLVVILGGAEAEASGLAAETVTVGDPTFAGPLAGVGLGLAVYHMVESDVKDLCDAGVYDEQVGVMEMVIDVDAISAEVKQFRDAGSKYTL